MKILAGVAHVDPIEVNYVPSSDEVFPVVSKSGCSTVKLCIIRRFNPTFESEFPEIHRVNIQEVTNGEITYYAFPTTEAYGKFCMNKKIVLVIRDPYLRFVSCYRGVTSAKNIMYFYPSRLSDLFSFSPSISLASFLNIVSRIPDKFADRHFRSQSYYLTNRNYGDNQNSKVVELEDFVIQSEGVGNIRLNKGQSPADAKMIQWLKQSKKFQRRYKADIALYESVSCE